MKTTFGFEIVYDSITSDAFIRGNTGVSKLHAISGDEGITFLELLGSGAIQTTTVTIWGEAVHSRHTIIAKGDMAPSQYYGSCN